MRARFIANAAFAGAALAVPLVLHNEFHLKLVFTTAMFWLAASGLNVLVGWSGQKSLGHAGLFAAGAYTAALLTSRWHWDPWLALAAAVVVSAAFGVLIALPALRVKGPSLAMVTISFGMVVEKVVTEWQQPFGGQQGLYGVTPLTFLGRELSIQGWAMIMLAIALAAHLMLRTLLAGRYGRAFLAVQVAEAAAQSVGIDVTRMKVLAFVISAVTCGVAGALMAQQNQYINSDFISFNLSVYLLLIALIGGPGITGPALGAILLSLLDAFLARWPAVQHFAYGALLLIALYAMPRGLSGALARGAGRQARVAPLPDAPGEWSLSAAPSGNEDGILLDARGLQKAYGGIVTTASVNVRLRRGHIHSLIGPNGAGKTTLLNILSGFVRADGGVALFQGADVARLKAHAVSMLGIGRTFQNLKLFPTLSVFDNVMVGLHNQIAGTFVSHLLGLPRARQGERAAREDAVRLLRMLGLLERAHEPAGSLPYGLQRRLEIARALAARPVLLMLDEPAAGLNPQETDELIPLIRHIAERGVTILLIEHHMDLVMAVSDHVIVLDHGMKIAEGPPGTVRQDAQVIAAYLGPDENTDAPRLNDAGGTRPRARYA